jgi:Outer membrane protein beta-barrel domain
MKRSSRVLGGLTGLLAAAALAIPAPAAAQTPQAEFSVGYQALHVPNLWFPFGIKVDGSKSVDEHLSVVAEVGWARKSESASALGVSADATLNAVNFGAGVRWNDRLNGKMNPYGQLLVGALHSSGGINVSAGGVTVNNSASATDFMIQPGVGVAMPLSANLQGVGAIDYRRVFSNPGENEFVVFVGVRVAR